MNSWLDLIILIAVFGLFFYAKREYCPPEDKTDRRVTPAHGRLRLNPVKRRIKSHLTDMPKAG